MSMSVTLPLAREFIRIKMNAEAVEKLPFESFSLPAMLFL